MESKYGRTSFRDQTYAQLVAMLAASRPADVGEAASGWQDLANQLDDAALTLEEQYTRVQDLWQGRAARKHAEMLKELLDGIRQVAWTARRVGDQVATAREKLDRARDRMTALPSADTGQAAAIMEELRDAYLNIDLPKVPAVADPPVPGPDGVPVFAADPAGGTLALFRNVWLDGLIAAAGAPLPGLLPTYPPGLAGPGQVIGPVPGGGSLPPTTVPDIGPSAQFNDGPGAGGRLGLDEEPVRAVGHSSLAPRIDAGAAVSTVAGLAGAGMAVASAAGTPPFMGGFIPPMMGGGAGGEFGRLDGRAAPPWLVETLTVFDAKVEVVPEEVLPDRVG
jgi:uncharacterized protein YukE